MHFDCQDPANSIHVLAVLSPRGPHSRSASSWLTLSIFICALLLFKSNTNTWPCFLFHNTFKEELSGWNIFLQIPTLIITNSKNVALYILIMESFTVTVASIMVKRHVYTKCSKLRPSLPVRRSSVKLYFQVSKIQACWSDTRQHSSIHIIDYAVTELNTYSKHKHCIKLIYFMWMFFSPC